MRRCLSNRENEEGLSGQKEVPVKKAERGYTGGERIWEKQNVGLKRESGGRL